MLHTPSISMSCGLLHAIKCLLAHCCVGSRAAESDCHLHGTALAENAVPPVSANAVVMLTSKMHTGAQISALGF